MRTESFIARDLVSPDLLPVLLGGATSGVLTALYADRGLIYSDNSFYQARLVGDAEVSQTAIDSLGLGGRIGLTVGELDLWNGDRALDAIASLGLANGRAARIKTVAAPTPSRSDAGGVLANAVTAFTGLVAGMAPNGRHMRLMLSDASSRLDVPLQSNLYGGTGGLDGSSDLKGKPKPLSFGWRFNVSPVYLGLVDLGDGAKQTYQTHWRGIAGHDVVKERGLAMTAVTSAPGIGQWRDWPTLGCFQLGFTPNGAVTCDVRGDAVGGYVSSTVDVLTRLLTTLGPLFASTDFDQGSLALGSIQMPGEIGWGIGTDVVSASAALEDIVSHCGAWAIGNRAGQLRFALPQAPSGVSNFALDVGDIVGLAPAALPASLSPAPGTMLITAAKNWTPMTDISSGVDALTRSLLTGFGQQVRVDSTVIAGRQVNSKSAGMDGLWRYTSDAQARAATLIAWLEKGLRAFTVTTDKYLGQVEIGHVGTLTYPLYGLASGFTGVVAGWQESQSKRRLTLTMVG